MAPTNTLDAIMKLSQILFSMNIRTKKQDYVQFNLDTPLEFPGNNQHQLKRNKKFSVKDRNNFCDWYNAFFRADFTFEALADGANISTNRVSPINGSFSPIKSMTVKSVGKTVLKKIRFGILTATQ